MNIRRTIADRAIISDQRGSALIITLLLVTVLVSLVVSFVYEIHIDSSSLANWSDAQRASYVARSGQVIGTRYLEGIREFTYTNADKTELPVKRDFGINVALTVMIEDENSKFNINSLIYENGSTNEKALSSLKKLLDYLNINPDLALLIADWIDPDSEPRLRYSEETAKDTYLWSTDELILIKGIDNDSFERIIPYVTVSEQWGRKININTAGVPVLVCLHNDLTEELAKRIIEYREDSPFEDWTHVQRVSGMEIIGQELAGRVDSKSTDFRITSKATVNDITRVIESVVDRSGKVSFWREG